MNSIKQVRDKTIIGVPNKISEHNAWGFQLIRVRENKMIQPQFLACHGPESALRLPLQKGALPGNVYELSLAGFHVSRHPFKKGPYQVQKVTLVYFILFLEPARNRENN